MHIYDKAEKCYEEARYFITESRNNIKGCVNVAGKINNYYAGGNTARGFYSLYEECLEGLDRIFILKGGPGTGKSTIIKEIGSKWVEKGYNIEYLHCSSDNNSVDGVIIQSLKVAVVDGTAPHVIEPKVPGAVEELINLGDAWDSQKLASEKKRIMELNEQVSTAFNNAYATFAKALKIHDEWEKIYIDNMDFEKANQLTDKLMKSFFGDMVLNKEAEVKNRFLGAATPKGAVDFVPNLTENLKRRYFIKGRPGSGKSTMLKKLAAEGESRGLDVEIYHCGFDPHSLDMVIFRELGISIFDSTAPHEYFPSREGDEIIDLYGTVIDGMTDDLFADKIETLSKSYKENMKIAISYLAEAKSLRDSLEKIYIEAMDFSIVTSHKEKIDAEIERLAK